MSKFPSINNRPGIWYDTIFIHLHTIFSTIDSSTPYQIIPNTNIRYFQDLANHTRWWARRTAKASYRDSATPSSEKSPTAKHQNWRTRWKCLIWKYTTRRCTTSSTPGRTSNLWRSASTSCWDPTSTDCPGSRSCPSKWVLSTFSCYVWSVCVCVGCVVPRRIALRNRQGIGRK